MANSQKILLCHSFYYFTISSVHNLSFYTGDDDCPLPLAAVGNVNKLWKKNDLLVYFLKPHPMQDQILEWANEWSKYCAIIFHHSLKRVNSDVRVDFEEGMFPYKTYISEKCNIFFLHVNICEPVINSLPVLFFIEKLVVVRELVIRFLTCDLL